MSLSNYAEAKLLDHMNGTTSWTMPAALYLALFTSNPDEDASGNEVDDTVDDTAYARQSITFAAATSGAGTAVTSNTQTFAAVVYGSGAAAYSVTHIAAVVYGSGAAAYSVTHIAVFDASTAGNMISYTALAAPISRTVGKTLVFSTGDISTLLG